MEVPEDSVDALAQGVMETGCLARPSRRVQGSPFAVVPVKPKSPRKIGGAINLVLLEDSSADENAIFLVAAACCQRHATTC